VAVVDTTPPVLTMPDDVITDATSLAGAAVTYAQPTAVDLVDGSTPVSCFPASGSVFPIGTTEVDCTARDKTGNTGTDSFSVVVLATPETILQQLIFDNNLYQAQNLLQSTVKALTRGNVTATCGKLGAFINQVQAQSGKTLRLEDTNSLIAQAMDARAALGCR